MKSLKLTKVYLEGEFIMIPQAFASRLKRHASDTEAELKHHTGFLNLATLDASTNRIINLLK